MNCEQYQEMASAGLDGALDERQARLLREHLAACPACRQVEADLEKTITLVRTLPQVEPPPYLLAGVRRRLAAEPKRGPLIWRILLQPQAQVLMAAAVLMIVVIRGYQPLTLVTREQPEFAKPETKPATVIPAPAGSKSPSSIIHPSKNERPVAEVILSEPERERLTQAKEAAQKGWEQYPGEEAEMGVVGSKRDQAASKAKEPTLADASASSAGRGTADNSPSIEDNAAMGGRHEEYKKTETGKQELARKWEADDSGVTCQAQSPGSSQNALLEKTVHPQDKLGQDMRQCQNRAMSDEQQAPSAHSESGKKSDKLNAPAKERGAGGGQDAAAKFGAAQLASEDTLRDGGHDWRAQAEQATPARSIFRVATVHPDAVLRAVAPYGLKRQARAAETSDRESETDGKLSGMGAGGSVVAPAAAPATARVVHKPLRADELKYKVGKQPDAAGGEKAAPTLVDILVPADEYAALLKQVSELGEIQVENPPQNAKDSEKRLSGAGAVTNHPVDLIPIQIQIRAR